MKKAPGNPARTPGRAARCTTNVALQAVPAFAAGNTLQRTLALIAFFLLATAMAVRPILGESWTVRANDLVSPSPLWWNNSPIVMYIAHILAAIGILVGALWVVVQRRPWRFSGLEIAAAILVVAAFVSVPAASDKRLAVNVAVGTILPLLVAAMLYQLLATDALWRRALLAAVVAAAVANCYSSTRQQLELNEQTWKHYLENKQEYWAFQGKNPNDPEVAIYEARIKARQPMGYFYHPNVLASFLLLGLAGTGAAAAGFGFRRTWRKWTTPDADPQKEPDNVPADARASGTSRRWRALAGILAIGALLAAIAIWHLVVIRWVGSAGAMAGIVLGGAAAVGVWFLRRTPLLAGLLCLAVLLALQVTLVALSTNAAVLYPKWAAADGKFKSMAVRLVYWKGALDLFARHPLTGVGPGQFGKHYISVKPPYAAEEVMHPHNWLMNTAAEWGILGLVGVIAALVVPGWMILRSLARSDEPAEQDRRPASAFLLAFGLTLGCYVVSLPGFVPAGLAVFLYMSEPLPYMLIAASLVSMSCLRGRAGGAILFGGLVAFFVHGTVEMGSAVAAAAWPFWTCMALALAWMGAPAVEPSAVPGAAPAGSPAASFAVARAALQKRPWPVIAGVAAAALLVLFLTIAPLRSVLAMNDARDPVADLQQLQKKRIEPARQVRLALALIGQAQASLQEASRLDPLDPAPHAALGMLAHQAALWDPARAQDHLRRAVDAAQAAVDRDPLDNVLWHDLAFAYVRLAVVTRRFSDAQAGIAAMRRAVELYPTSPRTRLDYAAILAGAGEPPDIRPELLREAIVQADKALELDAGWPAEDARKLSPAAIEEIRAKRSQILGWLDAAASRPTTQSAR